MWRGILQYIPSTAKHTRNALAAIDNAGHKKIKYVFIFPLCMCNGNTPQQPFAIVLFDTIILPLLTLANVLIHLSTSFMSISAILLGSLVLKT